MMRHANSIDHSLQKKYSLKPPEDNRQEKLLMIREERLGKIRQGFALKNRMNGKKVPSTVTANAKFNSFAQLGKKQSPNKEAVILDTDSAPLHHAPKFFDFCESNRQR